MLPQILTATALPLFDKTALDSKKSTMLVDTAIEPKAFPHRKWPAHSSNSHTDIEHWRLRIFGAVNDEIEFSWQDLALLPEAEASLDPGLTSFRRGARHWQGVDAWSLLALAGVRGNADWLIVHGEGGYNHCLELDRFFEGPALLAQRVDGELLSGSEGGPARLILPCFDVRFSAKWVRGLELSTKRTG